MEGFLRWPTVECGHSRRTKIAGWMPASRGSHTTCCETSQLPPRPAASPVGSDRPANNMTRSKPAQCDSPPASQPPTTAPARSEIREPGLRDARHRANRSAKRSNRTSPLNRRRPIAHLPERKPGGHASNQTAQIHADLPQGHVAPHHGLSNRRTGVGALPLHAVRKLALDSTAGESWSGVGWGNFLTAASFACERTFPQMWLVGQL